MATTLTKQIVAVPAQVPTVEFTIPVGTRIIGVDVLNLDGVAPQLGVAGRRQTGLNVIQDLIGSDDAAGQHQLEVQLAEDPPTSVDYTLTFVVTTVGPIASCDCTCSSGLDPSPVQVGEVIQIYTVDGNVIDAQVITASRVANTWTTTLGVAATAVSLAKSNIKCFGCY